MSLAMALGGIAGNIGVSWLATAASPDIAFLAVAAVVLVGAVACLWLPRTPRVELRPEDVAPAGVV